MSAIVEAFIAGMAKELYSRARCRRPTRDVRAARDVFLAYRDGLS